MSKTCKDCDAWQHNTYRGWHYCAMGQVDICLGNLKACNFFKPATVFKQITESPEVLAEKLVYRYDGNGTWRSFLLYGYEFLTKAEAIAATVARLKEVAE